MKQRIITKIGDVYVTKDGTYLQLVAIDTVQLNSDVVVVYDKAALNDIPHAEISFYHHTTVSVGVREGL